MEYYSVDGQDKFVIEYFNGKREGVFVEAGAYDGIGSNTLTLEKYFRWTGLLVEPHPLYYKKLCKNRPSCLKSSFALHNIDGEALFQLKIVIPCAVGIVTSYHPLHVKHLNEVSSNIENRDIMIPCCTINTLLEKYNLYNIDFLSLDTEGNEHLILKLLDVDRFNIKLITVEASYPELREEIHNILTSKGYRKIAELYRDVLYEKI